MEHIGIDLGASRSSLCILSSTGEITLETTVETRKLFPFLSKRPSSRVVIESCAESRKVALMARELDHQVTVVPTIFVRTLGIGTRGIKTDKRDARNLALAAFRLGDQLPHVHIRSDEAERKKELLGSRANLISLRTSAINFVRSSLRRQLKPRIGRAPKSFCANVRDAFDEVPLEIEVHLTLISTLNEQIALLDRKIRKLAEADQDAQRLQKIPGVGPIVALAFLATIDQPERFASAANVASYLGLSPGENTTGGNVKRTGIIAAGQRQMRSLLVQAAHSMMNSRRTTEPMAAWAREIERKKARKIAVCALARRLAVVMWAMLRDGSKYDPTLTKPRPPLARPSNEQIAANLARATAST